MSSTTSLFQKAEALAHSPTEMVMEFDINKVIEADANGHLPEPHAAALSIVISFLLKHHNTITYQTQHDHLGTGDFIESLKQQADKTKWQLPGHIEIKKHAHSDIADPFTLHIDGDRSFLYFRFSHFSQSGLSDMDGIFTLTPMGLDAKLMQNVKVSLHLSPTASPGEVSAVQHALQRMGITRSQIKISSASLSHSGIQAILKNLPSTASSTVVKTSRNVMGVYRRDSGVGLDYTKD